MSVRAILALPPLAGLLVVAIYVTIESVRPGTFTAPAPQTIAEAVIVGNGPRALEMIAEGQDVNGAGYVRPGVFGETGYDVTPIEAALLSQRIEVVRLLVRTGADVSRSTRAACLARTRLPEALPVLGLEPAEPVAGGFPACFTAAGHPSPQGRHQAVETRGPRTST